MTEKHSELFDVVIIGAGPAGIQAAIHAARKQAKTLVLGRIERSALFHGHIENYAFVNGVNAGGALLAQGLNQAQGFGAMFLAEDLMELEQDEASEQFSLTLESGRQLRARSLVLAMGCAKNTLGLAGEKELLGRGVSYCVDCDANFFKKATVCVTGDGSAAAGGALTLTALANKVYLVAEQLDISEELASQLDKSPVERINGTIARLCSDPQRGLSGVELANGRTLDLDGLFIEMGSKGALQLATQIGVELDSENVRYIAVNRKQKTNVPGVYAAGDITGPPFQMAKAVGEGCIAGMEAAVRAGKLKRREEKQG